MTSAAHSHGARMLDQGASLDREPADAADRAHKGSGRLTPSGFYKLLRRFARQAGILVPVSPHRLRHSAITDALDGTKGDVRRVQRFSRHSKIETLFTYDDRRRDDAGELAAMRGAALGRARTAAEEQEADDAQLSTDVPENACYREHLSTGNGQGNEGQK